MSIVFFKNCIGSLIIAIIVFSSCSDKGRNELSIYKEFDKSLSLSNQSIAESSENFYRSMQDRLADPKTTDNAKIWEPKAEMIKTLSNDIVNYIDNLKRELKTAANLKLVDSKEIYEFDNTEAANTLFISKGNGEELFRKLAAYKRNVLNVDSEINIRFSKIIDIGSVADDSLINGEKFSKIYFNNTPAISALTTLSRFQNQVRYTENKIAIFCHSECAPVVLCGFGSGPKPIIGQSANHLKFGDNLEITAGIGTFNVLAKISINGKKINIEPWESAAKYKFKVLQKFGKHKVPVKLEFTDENGGCTSFRI